MSRLFASLPFDCLAASRAAVTASGTLLNLANGKYPRSRLNLNIKGGIELHAVAKAGKGWRCELLRQTHVAIGHVQVGVIRQLRQRNPARNGRVVLEDLLAIELVQGAIDIQIRGRRSDLVLGLVEVPDLQILDYGARPQRVLGERSDSAGMHLGTQMPR